MNSRRMPTLLGTHNGNSALKRLSEPLLATRRRRSTSRRIYTTFTLGTALLNFGTGASNIGHGTLDFYRVKANFSARVPKSLGGPRPPQEVVSARLKRGPRAETRGNLFPRAFALTTLPRKRRLWGRK